MTDPPTVFDWTTLIIALVALLTSAVAAYFTWRAYVLQRIATTPAGLQFMIGSIPRTVPIQSSNPNERAYASRSHTTMGVYACGPGVRYDATVAVWGEVDARFLSKSRSSWSAEDEPLTAEMFVKRSNLDEPVYFGLVWESPSLFRRRFESYGYRVRFTWDARKRHVRADNFEVWSHRANAWKIMLRRGSDHARQPIAGCNLASESLLEQMNFKALEIKWV